MPPCDAQHMVAFLFELGPTVPAGMGEGAIDDVQIDAWQRNTGIELDAWQARTLRQMSKEYLAETYSAKDRACKTPWEQCPYAKHANGADDLRASIRKLAEL